MSRLRYQGSNPGKHSVEFVIKQSNRQTKVPSKSDVRMEETGSSSKNSTLDIESE